MSSDGGLPTGWCMVDLAEIIEDRVSQSGPGEASDFVYLDISSVNNIQKQILEPKKINIQDAPSRARQRVESGDILVSMTRPNLNAVAKVPIELDGSIASTGFHVLRSKIVEPDWLFAYVRSGEFVRKMSAIVQGALYPAIRPADIRAYQIRLPPRAEQRRIISKVGRLQSRIRKAVETLQEVPALLEQYRQSVLAAAFRGDLTADWRASHPDAEPASVLLDRIRQERRQRWEAAELSRMKSIPRNDSWKAKYQELHPFSENIRSDLPNGWCEVRFGDLLGELRNGVSSKPEAELPGQPILRINAVRPGRVHLDDLRYLREPFELNSLIADGDLLFTRYNGSLKLLGVCGLVRGLGEKKVLYPDKLMRVRFDHECVNIEYIEAYFAAPQVRRRIEEKAKSTAGQQGISGNDLKAQIIDLPPLAEQAEIVRILNKLTKSNEIVCDQILAILAELDNLDMSVLAQAFRGELVPQDPDDEPASVLLERIRAERDAAREPKKGRDRTGQLFD